MHFQCIYFIHKYTLHSNKLIEHMNGVDVYMRVMCVFMLEIKSRKQIIKTCIAISTIFIVNLYFL